MKRVFQLLIILFFSCQASSGQVPDTSFYQGGRIRDIRFFKDRKIVKATAYDTGGLVLYQWDMDKKILESFTSLSYTDTLAMYFENACPGYTLYQHYGNGPVMEIENYKGKMRHGLYQKFDRDGKLISAGNFDHWDKTGIWTYYLPDGKRDRHIHWFQHAYSEGGISIDYTIIPVAVTLMVITAFMFFFIKRAAFSGFFISFSLFTIGLFLAIYAFLYLADEPTIDSVRSHLGIYFFPVMATMTLSKTALSLTSLVFNKRTGVKRQFSILFLATGTGLCYLLMMAYIASKMTGVLM